VTFGHIICFGAMNGDFDPENIPFISLLSPHDKEIYLSLRAALAAPSATTHRNKKISNFREIVSAIDIFENSDQKDKWKRCLVCGLVLLPSGLAVNTTRLRHLVHQCKSSINASLKGLGYDVVVQQGECHEELLEMIPDLVSNQAELRIWTTRRKSILAPKPLNFHSALRAAFE
jgi:hypothetical protein